MGGEGDKKGIMRDIRGRGLILTFHRKSRHRFLAQQPTIRLNCRQSLILALRDQISGAADMDLFPSLDALSQIEEEKSEKSDNYGETIGGL